MKFNINDLYNQDNDAVLSILLFCSENGAFQEFLTRLFFILINAYSS